MEFKLKNKLPKEITVSAPGRICLFGEHQDYLQLPVIAMAIDLRVNISCTPRQDQVFKILLPDINAEQILDFSDGKEFCYTCERDYFRSIYNVLFRQGIRFTRGYDCLVQGNIPINSGTSSSSALNNAWCRFLLEIGDYVLPAWKEPEAVGHFSYQAEVIEFQEPGGMMDQLSTAFGNIIYIDFADNNRIEILPAKLGTFVLGDSGQAKNTRQILARIKEPALAATRKIAATGNQFSFADFSHEHLAEFRKILTAQEYQTTKAMLINRNITRDAYQLLSRENPDHHLVGKLLNKHHHYLDKYLGISTEKINKMLSAALEAGAYGGKINGSGGGGCLFVYAPENPQEVAAAITKSGGKTYLINQHTGLDVNYLE